MDQSASGTLALEPRPEERGWAGVWAAFTVLAIAGILALSAWPLSVPASMWFIATFGCITSVAYLSTALLLSNRLVISRTPAIVPLASAFLLCGLSVAAATLTFPGVAPFWWKNGPEATRWFWVLWHAASAIGIIGFVALDDEWMHRQDVDAPEAGARDVVARMLIRDVGAFVRGPFLFAAIALGGATVWLWRDPKLFATWFGAWALPPAVSALLLILDIAAIVLLAFALRRDHLVRAWLVLAAVASMLDVAATAWSAAPFTIGWYFSHACALAAASVLPIVLLMDLRSRMYAGSRRPQLDASLTDPQTGFANEHGLMKQLDRISLLAVRSGAPVSIAIAVADDPVGAAKVLDRIFRASDVIGRIAEREFAVILTPGSAPNLTWLRNRLAAGNRFGLRIGVGSCDPARPRSVGELLAEGLRSARQALGDGAGESTGANGRHTVG